MPSHCDATRSRIVMSRLMSTSRSELSLFAVAPSMTVESTPGGSCDSCSSPSGICPIFASSVSARVLVRCVKGAADEEAHPHLSVALGAVQLANFTKSLKNTKTNEKTQQAGCPD